MYKEGKRKRYRSPKVDRMKIRRWAHSIVQFLQYHRGDYEVIESINR